ncbi:MAG: DMT family transporter [Gammaproteobacteria bacterium]
MKKTLLPLSILFSLGITWGSGYAIARFATTHGVHPIGYTFWQSLGPAVLLSLFCLFKRRISGLAARAPKLVPTQKIEHLHTPYKFYALCGLLGIAVPNTIMYYAAAHLPASLLALVINTVPMMIYPLALLAKQESFNFRRFLALVITIVGLACLVVPNAHFSGQQAKWILIALLTPLCFALFANFVNPRRPANSQPLNLAAGMMIFSTLWLLPVVFSTHSFYSLWPLTLPGWVIILEMILSSLGYVLLFKLLTLAGPVYYSLVDGVVAITGLLWGVLLFQERFNVWQSIAVCCILGGIGLMSWMRKR